MADRIVYSQRELIKALNDGLRAITLCAGIYEIPLTGGVSFDRLGPVIVRVSGTRRAAEAMGMIFTDIYPEYKSGFAADFRAPLRTPVFGGSYGSYGGSGYYGSYGLFGGSGIFGSFIGYAGAYAGSGFGFSGFGSGYIPGSAGSFSGLGGGSVFLSGSLGEANSAAPFPILGYGIELI